MVIKWKNILNRGNKTDRAPAPAACPAEGRLRAAAGLTAFLLGISLLLAGGLGQYGWWSTELGARWARDSLEEAEGSVKLAITMILLQCGAKSAKTRLNRAGGYVRNAIQDV